MLAILEILFTGCNLKILKKNINRKCKLLNMDIGFVTEAEVVEHPLSYLRNVQDSFFKRRVKIKHGLT